MYVITRRPNRTYDYIGLDCEILRHVEMVPRGSWLFMGGRIDRTCCRVCDFSFSCVHSGACIAFSWKKRKLFSWEKYDGSEIQSGLTFLVYSERSLCQFARYVDPSFELIDGVSRLIVSSCQHLDWLMYVRTLENPTPGSTTWSLLASGTTKVIKSTPRMDFPSCVIF